MLEKKALKKFINAYGKEEQLIWGYKDGKHYLSNANVLICGTEAVFDTEILGLLYKYFGMIPKSSDAAYRNRKDVDNHGNKTYTCEKTERGLQAYMDLLQIKDEYPALTFSKVYVKPKTDDEIALYVDADNLACVCIKRMYHQLIDWDVFAGMIVHAPRGIIFEHFETGTTMMVCEVKASKASFLSIINHAYRFAGDPS